MTKGSNVTARARSVTVLKFNSPGFNRSRYLVLYTHREFEREGYPTDFNPLYVNCAILYQGLLCALPRWSEWKYLHFVWKEGKKEYRISWKGR
jgi:hypothetical protein